MKKKYNNNHSTTKSAFTLAEVLITLGIIGIVAAITMPMLIESHKNAELQSRLKKSYSVLSQVTERVIQEDNGGVTPVPGDGYSSVELLLRSYESYLIKSSTCYSGQSNCDTSAFPISTNDSGQESIWTGKNYTNIANRYLMDDGMMALNDGSFVWFDFGNGITGNYVLTIDTNGWRNKPNKGGLDLFTFQLTANGHLTPMGAKGATLSNANCYTAPNNYCTSVALSDSEYFKKVKK